MKMPLPHIHSLNNKHTNAACCAIDNEEGAAAEGEQSADDGSMGQDTAGMPIPRSKSSPLLAGATAKVRFSTPSTPVVVARLDAGSLLKSKPARAPHRQSLAPMMEPAAARVSCLLCPLAIMKGFTAYPTMPCSLCKQAAGIPCAK